MSKPELEDEINRLNLAIEIAWGLIANMSGGNWAKQDKKWITAAKQWRDTYIKKSDSTH